jgi:hypothetical protein
MLKQGLVATEINTAVMKDEFLIFKLEGENTSDIECPLMKLTNPGSLREIKNLGDECIVTYSYLEI